MFGCVSVRVCLRVYLCACVFASLCACVFVCNCELVHLCVRVRVEMNECVSERVEARAHVWLGLVFVCVCACVRCFCLCVCLSVCACVWALVLCSCLRFTRIGQVGLGDTNASEASKDFYKTSVYLTLPLE